MNPSEQQARDQARTRRSEAVAYKNQRISEAVTSRLLALQKEYENASDVTRAQVDVIDTNKGRVPLHLKVTSP